MKLDEWLEQEALQEQGLLADKEKLAEAMSARPHMVLMQLLDGIDKVGKAQYAKYPQLKESREERGESPLGKKASPEAWAAYQRFFGKEAEWTSGDLPDIEPPKQQRARVTRSFKHPGWGKGYVRAPSTPAGRAEIFQRKMNRMLGYTGPGPKDQPVARAKPVSELSRAAFGPSLSQALAAKTPALKATQRRTDEALLGAPTPPAKPAQAPVKPAIKTGGMQQKLAEAREQGTSMARRDYRRILAVSDPEGAIRQLYHDEGTADMVKTATFQEEVSILRTIGALSRRQR